MTPISTCCELCYGEFGERDVVKLLPMDGRLAEYHDDCYRDALEIHVGERRN